MLDGEEKDLLLLYEQGIQAKRIRLNLNQSGAEIEHSILNEFQLNSQTFILRAKALNI